MEMERQVEEREGECEEEGEGERREGEYARGTKMGRRREGECGEEGEKWRGGRENVVRDKDWEEEKGVEE